MKRSEMLGKIELFLRLNHHDPRHMDKAEAILKMMEDNGMLPPERVRVADFPNGQSRAFDENSWESEYEEAINAGRTSG